MLKELLKDHQLFHSEFQQDYYITSKAGGTLYGQYKQALRELYKRTRGLRESYCDREKLKVEIEEQFHIKTTSSGFIQKYAEIEHKRKTMQMEESNRVIEDTEREFKRFYQQALYLKEQIGELTDNKRRQLDKEMWEFRVKEMAVIDFVTQGHLSPTTYEFITAFPIKDRIKLLQSIDNRDKQIELIDWYEKDKREMKLEFKDVDISKCLSEI